MPSKRKPKPTPSALEDLLGHAFARPELLALALTHRSCAYEARNAALGPDSADLQRNQPGTDNEQLEFVGDAVLELAITEAMFREFPQCSEGELTRLRSSLVSRSRMAEMGAELGLADHIKLGRSAEQNGGRRKPALLANTAEAVIAAVYLDALATHGDGMAAIRPLVQRYLVQPSLAAMRSALARESGRGAMRDHKTLLQERVQATAAGRLRYIDTAEEGPPHQRRFSVAAQLESESGTRTLAEAEGPTKKQAQQRAAELALAHWPPEALP